MDLGFANSVIVGTALTFSNTSIIDLTSGCNNQYMNLFVTNTVTAAASPVSPTFSLNPPNYQAHPCYGVNITTTSHVGDGNRYFVGTT